MFTWWCALEFGLLMVADITGSETLRRITVTSIFTSILLLAWPAVPRELRDEIRRVGGKLSLAYCVIVMALRWCLSKFKEGDVQL